VYLFGLVWFCVWSLIAGFSTDGLMLDFCRALQGLGPAAFLPSGVSLMGSIHRPGPRKNIVFSLYGGSAPLGFFFGVFIAGLTGQFLRFGWYFWIGAILLFTTVTAAYLTVPSDMHAHKEMRVEMDWLGSALIVSGPILVVFAALQNLRIALVLFATLQDAILQSLRIALVILQHCKTQYCKV
jgi:predicted MFS family arabinose efflux permease